MMLAIAGGIAGETIEAKVNGVALLARAAKDSGANLLCFPEWFFGVEAVPDFEAVSVGLQRVAADTGMAIITGNILTELGDEYVQERVLAISSSGLVLLEQHKQTPYQLEERNYRDGGELHTADFPWGTTLVLNGLDAVDEDVLSGVGSLNPAVIVIQLNPSSQLEAESLKELAITMSETYSAVLAVPILEADALETGIGSFIVSEGEVVAEADGATDLLVAECEVAPGKGLWRTNGSLKIPELLKQRFLSEVAGGSYFSDLGDDR